VLECISWELARCLFHHFNDDVDDDDDDYNNNNNHHHFSVVGRKEELVCSADRNVEIERNCTGNR